MPRRAGLALALLAIAWWFAAARPGALPEDRLVADSVDDDAVYYAPPATNLWAGRGLSLNVASVDELRGG
jgi:hypothetical protein